MSTIERLAAMLESAQLSDHEKQALRDAIRLIQGFQADRIAAYEESTKRITPQDLRNAVEEMDGLAQTGFSEIATMAKLSLLLMEQPSAYKNGGGMDQVATMLSAIWGKALDIENCINSSAENVGCNCVDQAQRRRWAAERRAKEVANAGGLSHA